MIEPEIEGIKFSFDSPISEVDDLTFKPGYNQIPPTMLDEIRRVFWDHGKPVTDIDPSTLNMLLIIYKN